jgi:OOP family OmpA-OmpF porin
MRRAKSLSDYFQQNGIGTDQIKISSKGETEPIANNDTDEGRAKNRRVELTIKN